MSFHIEVQSEDHEANLLLGELGLEAKCDGRGVASFSELIAQPIEQSITTFIAFLHCLSVLSQHIA